MSNFSDPMKLFNMLKEQTQTSKQTGFGNQNILKLQRGKTYSLRLLWLPSDERQNPMINQYVHRIWDDKAIGSKEVVVQCPTSQYDLDSAGFKACPICTRMSELYKEASEGSSSAEELYKKFKRTLRGYVPVYVVNGPSEDLHKVKILQYSISFKRYFDTKIFGIKPETKDGEDDAQQVDESNCVGISAFMYYDPKTNKVITNGHNFIITVGTKKVPIDGRNVEMPDYKLDFSMKPTDITDFDGVELTADYFINLSKEIGFDRDFYIMSNIEKINNFKMKYIDGVDEVMTESKSEETSEEDTIEDLPPKPVKKAEKKKVEEDAPVLEKEEEESSEEKSEDDIDLDELLKDI